MTDLKTNMTAIRTNNEAAHDAYLEARDTVQKAYSDGLTPKDIRSKGTRCGKLSYLITNLRHAEQGTEVGSPSRLLLQESVDALGVAEEALESLAWNAKAKAGEVMLAAYEVLVVSGNRAASTLSAKQDGQPVARLPEIEDEIKDSVSLAAGALLKVGHLLNEAREEFNNAKEFLAWADDVFEFKKTFVYRLMSVASAFGENDPLSGESIAVLHKLAGMPEEVKAAAREASEEGAGSLTAKAVQGLQDRLASSAEPDAPEAGQAHTQQDNASHSEAQAAPVAFSEDVDTGAPWDTSACSEAPSGSGLAEVPADSAEELKRLTGIIQELQAELAAIRQEGKGKKSQGAAPYLPQFDSGCLYARLGLSAEESMDAAKVRTAFRMLVKAGYNSQHEAHGSLLEAFNTLSKAEAA